MCLYGPQTVSIEIRYTHNTIIVLKESLKNILDVLKYIEKDDFKVTANKKIKSFKLSLHKENINNFIEFIIIWFLNIFYNVIFSNLK